MSYILDVIFLQASSFNKCAKFTISSNLTHYLFHPLAHTCRYFLAIISVVPHHSICLKSTKILRSTFKNFSKESQLAELAHMKCILTFISTVCLIRPPDKESALNIFLDYSIFHRCQQTFVRERGRGRRRAGGSANNKYISPHFAMINHAIYIGEKNSIIFMDNLIKPFRRISIVNKNCWTTLGYLLLPCLSEMIPLTCQSSPPLPPGSLLTSPYRSKDLGELLQIVKKRMVFITAITSTIKISSIATVTVLYYQYCRNIKYQWIFDLKKLRRNSFSFLQFF